MKEDLLDFYYHVLSLLGVQVVEGFLEMPLDDKFHRLTIDDIPIIFIDNKFVTSPEVKKLDKVVYFHPLSESSVSQPSEMHDLMRRVGGLRISLLAHQLINVAIQLNKGVTDKSVNLTTNQSLLFKDIGKIDDAFIKFSTNVLEKTLEDSSKYIFEIYTKATGGDIDGMKYDRITSIPSPFFDELEEALDNKAYKVYGVKGRKADIELLRNIFLALFPIYAEGGYKVGSSNKLCPNLLSIIDVLTLILGRINEVVGLLGAAANGIKDATTNLDFNIDKLDLSALRACFNISKYNIGYRNNSQRDEERVRELEEEIEREPERKPERSTPRQQEPIQTKVPSVPPSILNGGRQPRTNKWTIEVDEEETSKPREEERRRRNRDDDDDYDDRRRRRSYDDEDDDRHERRRESRYRDDYDDDYDRRRRSSRYDDRRRSRYDDDYDDRHRRSRRYDDDYDDRVRPMSERMSRRRRW